MIAIIVISILPQRKCWKTHTGFASTRSIQQVLLITEKLFNLEFVSWLRTTTTKEWQQQHRQLEFRKERAIMSVGLGPDLSGQSS